jgi:hypothetical protein
MAYYIAKEGPGLLSTLSQEKSGLLRSIFPIKFRVSGILFGQKGRALFMAYIYYSGETGSGRTSVKPVWCRIIRNSVTYNCNLLMIANQYILLSLRVRLSIHINSLSPSNLFLVDLIIFAYIRSKGFLNH